MKEVHHTPVRENTKVAVDGKQLRQRFKMIIVYTPRLKLSWILECTFVSTHISCFDRLLTGGGVYFLFLLLLETSRITNTKQLEISTITGDLCGLPPEEDWFVAFLLTGLELIRS